MRGYCRKCRTEWTGPAGFTDHLHPAEVQRCDCGEPTYKDNGTCASCDQFPSNGRRTQAVAS